MLTCCLAKRSTRSNSTDSTDEHSGLTKVNKKTDRGGGEKNGNYCLSESAYGTYNQSIPDQKNVERGYIRIPLEGLSQLKSTTDRESKLQTGRSITKITGAEVCERSSNGCDFRCDRFDKSSMIAKSTCSCQKEKPMKFSRFSNNAYGKYEEYEVPFVSSRKRVDKSAQTISPLNDGPPALGICNCGSFGTTISRNELQSDPLELCSLCSKQRKGPREGKGKELSEKTFQRCSSCPKDKGGKSGKGKELLKKTLQRCSPCLKDEGCTLETFDVTILYRKQVIKAEHTERPLNCWLGRFGVPHVGVIVTTLDGQRWLIHKSKSNGRMDTVITDTKSMTSNWTIKETRSVSRYTVGDFVKASGSKYNLLTDNCFDAKTRMMKLCQ